MKWVQATYVVIEQLHSVMWYYHSTPKCWQCLYSVIFFLNICCMQSSYVLLVVAVMVSSTSSSTMLMVWKSTKLVNSRRCRLSRTKHKNCAFKARPMNVATLLRPHTLANNSSNNTTYQWFGFFYLLLLLLMLH